jgi:hypothetical protein
MDIVLRSCSAAAAAGFEIGVQVYVAPDSGKGADNAGK